MPSVRLLLKLTIIAATSRSTRVFYDRVSPFYESVFTDHLPHIRTMAAALSERFPAQHQVKVLDMACGTGALSRRLEERGFSVTGLDFSFQSLRRLNQTTQTIRLIQADAAALPFSSGSFDVVQSRHTGTRDEARRESVKYVPGLICKVCARSVPVISPARKRWVERVSRKPSSPFRGES